MALNDAMPSSATDVFKRNAEDADRLLNASGAVTNRLGNQLLSWEQITQSHAAWNNRGAWATATAYAVNDIWEDGGIWYVVLSAYTSGASAAADIAGTNVAILQSGAIFADNYQDIRDYAGLSDILYAKGKASIADGGQNFFQKVTGAAPATYTDNGVDVIVPTGGDGSEAWVSIGSIKPASTISELRGLTPVYDGQQVELLGHTLAGIGGGTFYYDASDTTSADNNGTVIVTSGGARWKRRLPGKLNLEMFGGLPNGVSPVNSALRAALDAGAVEQPKGTYLLSGTFELQSGDNLVGAGVDTLFKTASGVMFAFGAIDAGAFTSGNVSYSIANNPKVGEGSITMSTPADAGKYSIGEVVAIWSQEGYTDGLSTFKPLYQQLVSVKSVDVSTGLVELDDTIYKAYTGAEFRVTKGSEVTNSEGVTNGFTRDITFGNLSVETPNDSWTRFGGTYNANIFNINCVKTHGLFVNNGFARSVINGIGGSFSRRVQDLAYFSHDSDLVFNPASCSDSSGLQPLVTFAEGAHDNTVKVSSISSAISPSDQGNVVAFNIGSVNNKVTGGVIRGGNFLNAVRALNLESGVSVMDHHGNVLDNIDIHLTRCTSLVNTKALTTQDVTGLTITDTVKIHSDVNVTDSIRIESSGVHLHGATISSGNGVRAITVSSGVSDCEITRCKFSSTPNLAGISDDADAVVANNSFGSDSLISRALTNFSSPSAISSTSDANTVITKVFPAGTLLNNDVIKFEAFLQLTGANDVKNIAIRVNGTNYAVYSSLAVSSSLSVRGSLNLTSLTEQRIYLAGQDGVSASLGRGASFIDTNVTDLTVEVALWVDNASDTIVPDSVTMQHFRGV